MADHSDMLRIPPQSVPAEQSVLGGLMLAPKAWHNVSDLLTAADFYRRDHQLIFRAIRELAEKNKLFDAVTLGEWFEALGLDEQVAGGAYLIELASTTPSAANIRAYAQIVADKALLRRLIEAGTEMVNDGYNPDGRDSVEIIGKALTAVGSLLETQPCELEEMTPVLNRMFANLQRRYAMGGAIDGLSTGLTDLDRVLNGLKGGRMYVIASRPKMGKEQPNSALVRVPGGWKRIDELLVGDDICSPDGAPSEVVGVYPQGVSDVYRVTFADGRTARCGIEHLWEVRHRKWAAPKVIDTRQLMVLIDNSPGRYSVRMVSGNFEPAAALAVDPWLIGFLIGDGSLTTSVGFSTVDTEILDHVRETVGPIYSVRKYGSCDYRIVTPRGQPNPLLDNLRALGLYGCRSPDKRIPPHYLHGDRVQRLQLLRGLIDADGWVEKSGCVQIGTSSPGLAGDIRTLVWSLGGKCSRRVKPTKSLDSHVLTLNLGPQQVPAWLPRKVDRLKGGRGEQQWLTVKAVAAEGVEEECTCIKVSHPSELYVTDDYVVTHNTTLALNIAEHVTVVQGKPVSFFSFEMQQEELSEKITCSLGRIEHQRFRTGQLEDEDWSLAAAAIAKLQRAPLRLSRPHNARVDSIIAQVRRLHAKKPQALVIIDYLQLLETSGSENRTTGIGEISRKLKMLSIDLDIPVIVLSQLSRSLESRPNKRPIPSDLRDSGAIEQDADAVIFLYRDEVYNPGSPDTGTTEINVALQRNGPSDMVRVATRLNVCRFDNLADSWQRAPEPEKPRSGGFKRRSYRDRASGED